MRITYRERAEVRGAGGGEEPATGEVEWAGGEEREGEREKNDPLHYVL